MPNRKAVELRVLLLILIALLLCFGASAQEKASAKVIIDAGKVENRISPMLYGQFMEFMFEGVKGGVHAELLKNRGFEEPANVIGLSRYWEREPDDRNDEPVRFAWDNAVQYPVQPESEAAGPGHSLRIELGYPDGQFRGIRQGRMPVRKGLPYKGYLWLKTDGFEGRVRVALGQDQTGGVVYATADLTKVTGDQWQKYEFTLTPTQTDALAKFSILAEGRGRLWIDQVSLIPGDAIDGVRADVFEKVRGLRPSFVRWPGGNVAQDYRWMWGIGPVDRRTIWTNLSWWNEPETSEFGTDEFIKFCRNLKTEPSITVNVEGRGATVEEAAAWVEYANGPATSKYGAMRVANGNPEPFRVKYWEVGNEIWGNWVRGHSDAETYARNYNRYNAAMKAVDSTIKFIAVGDNDMNWNRTVLQKSGHNIDYLAIHHYYGEGDMQGDALNLMARPLYYERFYGKVRELIRETVPGRDIKLAINEWNTSLSVPRQHSMESALYAARLMNVFERTGDLIEMTAVSDIVNGWSGGVIQASRHGVFVTPTYLVNSLYASRLGSERLATTVEGPTFNTSKEGNNIPYLDVVSSRASDGKYIFIKAVNTDPKRAIVARVQVSGVHRVAAAESETINGATLHTANSFENPNAVSVTRKSLKPSRDFVYEFPAHSVTVITLAAQK